MSLLYNLIHSYQQISTTMLRKKNYKQQEHFSQLYSFSVYSPASGQQRPRKYQVYYKRYRPQPTAQNLYSILTSQNQKGEEIEVTDVVYSADRTLELISFDGNLGFLKGLLRKIGKIRQYDTGEGVYKGQKIHTAMCVFKFEFDLVKCFRDDYLQVKMDENSLGNAKEVREEDREEERSELISKYMGKQLGDKVEKLKQLQEGGFQVVTDRFGQYKLDVQANKKLVENLPQVKKKKKREEKDKKAKELKALEAQHGRTQN